MERATSMSPRRLRICKNVREYRVDGKHRATNMCGFRKEEVCSDDSSSKPHNPLCLKQEINEKKKLKCTKMQRQASVPEGSNERRTNYRVTPKVHAVEFRHFEEL